MISERARLERKAFLEELEREERAKQEKLLAPIREQEQQLAQTSRELYRIQRENILNLPDPELYLSPSLSGASMTEDQASEFNRIEAEKFSASEPDWCPTAENIEAIMDYFHANRLQIVDCETYKRAFHRLRSLGLITTEPVQEFTVIEPEIQPRQHEAPIQGQQANTGIDQVTGQEREFTALEIARMSADEFRRTFAIPSLAEARRNQFLNH